MIVKYSINGVWGYVGDVKRTISKNFDYAEMLKKYEEYFPNKGQDSPAYHRYGDFHDENILAANKIFIATWREINKDKYAHYAENLLDFKDEFKRTDICSIMLFFDNNKEDKTLLLISNQQIYLMDDKGQTIERLS